MERRSFLAGMGLVSAEVLCLQRLWAFQAPTSAQTAFVKVTDAVSFKKFDGRLSLELLRHRKFRYYIQTQFGNAIARFHWNRTMWHAIWGFMSPGEVKVEHNRFLVVAGYMKDAAVNRGMMWIDATKPKVGAPVPLAILVFLAYEDNTLWIVPNRPISNLTYSELPHHFRMTMTRWLRSRRPVADDRGYVRRVFFYESSVPSTSAALGVGNQQTAPILANFGIKPYRTVLHPITKTKPVRTSWARIHPKKASQASL
jgi:hypothetical protein